MTSRIRIATTGLLLALAGACPGGTAGAADESVAVWLAEFEAMTRHVSAAWANLEWIVTRRGVDPRVLAETARSAIGGAGSRAEARRAITSFIEGFGDPHFRVEELPSAGGAPRGAASDEPARPQGGTSPRAACDFFGYRKRDLDFRLPWAKQQGWKALESEGNPFAAGTLETAVGRRLGVLRIAHFGEDGYPDVCEEVWASHRRSLKGPCDDDCAWSFRAQVTRRLLEHLESRIEALGRLRPGLLVVDLTGNGGGTDWMHQAARMLTARPLSCPRASFVKHPHWQRPLAAMQEELAADLARQGWSEADLAALASAASRAARLIDEARNPCDRTGWFAPSAAPVACSGIVESPYTVCGLLDYLPPGALAGAASREAVFKPLRHPYREGVWRGPLAVLVDGGTASASEGFVSLLDGNDAATIVGARTHGSGCGYTNGGLPFDMPAAGLRVRLPDCARFRADGVNEIEGFPPDLDAGWSRGESADSRLRKAMTLLERLAP